MVRPLSPFSFKGRNPGSVGLVIKSKRESVIFGKAPVLSVSPSQTLVIATSMLSSLLSEPEEEEQVEAAIGIAFLHAEHLKVVLSLGVLFKFKQGR